MTSPLRPARPRTLTLLAMTIAGPATSGTDFNSAAASFFRPAAGLAVRNALQPLDHASLRFKHPAHFAILALGQIQFHDALRLTGRDQPRLLRLQVLALIPHALEELSEDLRFQAALNGRQILLADAIPRMGQ